jgi:APA family basic amino acid/polyamine antiporter
MRKTNPDAERGFRVPFVPVFPIVGVIICLILMAGLLLKVGRD